MSRKLIAALVDADNGSAHRVIARAIEPVTALLAQDIGGQRRSAELTTSVTGLG